MDWPWYNAWCGDIDLIGDKKPQSYYRDVLWRRQPITLAVHPPVPEGRQEDVNFWGWTNELNHWNWKDYEGQAMQVNVYSRAARVRLYQDNTLIGEKETGKENYTATFTVPYTKGILRAETVEVGSAPARVELTTTGQPTTLRLTADRPNLHADKGDLAYVKIELTDSEGRVVPDADVSVKVQVSGVGRLLAAGNASPDDMKSFRSTAPSTFRGRALAIVQPTGEQGTITLTVTHESIGTATLTLPTSL
jgi:beta-galactosidase